MHGLTPGFWLASGACGTCGATAARKVFTPGDHAVPCDACRATTVLPAEFRTTVTGVFQLGKSKRR